MLHLPVCWLYMMTFPLKQISLKWKKQEKFALDKIGTWQGLCTFHV